MKGWLWKRMKTASQQPPFYFHQNNQEVKIGSRGCSFYFLIKQNSPTTSHPKRGTSAGEASLKITQTLRFINLWSFGNLKIKSPNTPKGTMDQFSHSGKLKRQQIHSVKRICLTKEDLAEFIEALCNQERYVCKFLS
ncbi:hypothetical protein SO802_011697 [Lithocarpus litseifolius]|uniref:Uncharacterized protein n=1 Tax=Lithocarpus litseifolius TaxID=425828 RepID=A0AAW2D1F5_9ROSI